MKTPTGSLTRLVQAYFESHLPVERGLRPHTIIAYRDTIKLYLKYLSRDVAIQRLTLDSLTAKSILDFIEDCAIKRKNAAKTTNQRLAVLKSFFGYLMNMDPTRIAQYEKIFHVKAKRVPYRPVEYLERSEMKAIFGAVDRSTEKGVRDYAALMFLYNTGARAQELCDVTCGDLRLERPLLAILHGKGNKTRQVPLWPETASAIEQWMKARGKGAASDNDALFTNASGAKLTRFGLRYILNDYVRYACAKAPSLAKKKIGPHTIRHTTAMHLLQSGVDITIIKAWLGHVDLNTTHGYVEISMKMKEEALNKAKPSTKKLKTSETASRKEKHILEWLETFGDM
ncbi:MAG: site-specific integrase [Oligoflexia bacterium]|nr:site-specific integrase [Oligoflexia bacterium]